VRTELSDGEVVTINTFCFAAEDGPTKEDASAAALERLLALARELDDADSAYWAASEELEEATEEADAHKQRLDSFLETVDTARASPEEIATADDLWGKYEKARDALEKKLAITGSLLAATDLATEATHTAGLEYDRVNAIYNAALKKCKV
jgi:hypothetical protein